MELSKVLNVVVLSDYDSLKNNINSYLKVLGYTNYNYTFVDDIKDIINLFNRDEFVLFIINKVHYTKTDLDILTKNNLKSEVILISGESEYMDIFKYVYKFGTLVAKRPLAVNTFLEIIKLSIYKYNKRISNNNREIVYIAKVLLINSLRMSENEAHKFLERQSMDLGLPINEIAKDIVNKNLMME
ncbi:MAG: ANTAR domain-containing protein [Acholeplasmatales bacterium]|nr:ANTAR domain-containing protein [Acholeplasmatales bacterium]